MVEMSELRGIKTSDLMWMQIIQENKLTTLNIFSIRLNDIGNHEILTQKFYLNDKIIIKKSSKNVKFT